MRVCVCIYMCVCVCVCVWVGGCVLRVCGGGGGEAGNDSDALVQERAHNIRQNTVTFVHRSTNHGSAVEFSQLPSN